MNKGSDAGLTEAQWRVLRNLTPEPQAARRGGPWSPIAAFNLVWPGYVELHQSYRGDRYSLTKRGAELKSRALTKVEDTE